jgi:SSS family solute:Na+ symporter
VTEGFKVDGVAIAVFCFLFGLVTVMGFVAARWKRGDLGLLDEWGLGGRRFGTVITWFLLGGDLFTAYTFIAVPALVWAVGAGGFFALPYTILVFPLVSCSRRCPTSPSSSSASRSCSRASGSRASGR